MDYSTSEFIRLKDAPHIVSTCFKHPFSKPDERPTASELPKRNIILVGHDVAADINYLRAVGYDVHNLSNLLEIVDTASMWRYVKRDTNPRNLGSILAELDILGWNLHNAGNDAVYTLQVMIKIAIQALKRSVKEATQAAWDREQGWSSGGENSDGGAPVRLLPLSIPALQKGASYSQPLNRLKTSRPWQLSSKASNNHPSGSLLPQNSAWGGSNVLQKSSHEAVVDESCPTTEDDSKPAELVSTENAEREGNNAWGTSYTSTLGHARDDDDDLIAWK